MKNGSHNSEQVSLLRGRETDAVHGVGEVRELFLVLETGVMERGWVEVLEEGREEEEEEREREREKERGRERRGREKERERERERRRKKAKHV